MAVRLRFPLRSGSVGLFEDIERCDVMEEDRCGDVDEDVGVGGD